MPSYEDELQELQEFLLISLNFHQERKILSQAFLCPHKGTCFVVTNSGKMRQTDGGLLVHWQINVCLSDIFIRIVH